MPVDHGSWVLCSFRSGVLTVERIIHAVLWFWSSPASCVVIEYAVFSSQAEELDSSSQDNRPDTTAIRKP